MIIDGVTPSRTNKSLDPEGIEHPFCFSCGYDLFGLAFPCACPECGYVRDPAIDESAARKWFANGRNALTWLFRPSKIPAGIWYVLSDDTSRRIARRREFRWFWLPAMLATVMVGVGCFVTIDYNVKVWYYDQSDPQRAPLRVVQDTEMDRLFAFNLHLFRGGMFFSKPPSWIEVTERTPKRTHLSVPEEFNPFILIFGGALWFTFLFGYLPIRLLMSRRSSRRAWPTHRLRFRHARGTAMSLMAAPIGVAFYLWLAAVIAFGAGQAIPPHSDTVAVNVACVIFAALGSWVLASIVGYPVLVYRDRASCFIGGRPLWCFVFVAIALGGPIGAVYGMAWLLG